MRSWHDDTNRLCYSNAYATVRRTYCEQHRRRLFADETSERHYEFSENESLVNSLESSTASDCRFERRLPQQYESPTSCLKRVTDVKKNKSKKRVNFAEEEEEEASSSISSSASRQSSKTATAIARRYVNEPTTMTNYSEIMQSSTSALEDMSLSSSASARCRRCDNPPRIVKPRDVLRRPAARKMMIYPPEGQRGEPITLSKKWSKIQCRVNGDEDTGFRYKIYYLQTYESDKWFANDKTHSPFDDNDQMDNSTDYGN